ncbi:galactinol--sucrose galactosyltransferase-like isoform X1 [Amaranthus tricolor]|uniref:galactinol--sucrose galactosyltransferase-like isoform X1 n=1 Tax=Amaranthus tricolor TaxID=29722 RepID=UPI002588120F|nr:galactinol--sucrose galactosyltransferase-like isoform X1 [Amaranthus tricolor]
MSMAPSLSKKSSDLSDVLADNDGCDMCYSVTLEKSNFMVNGHVILSNVPSNVTACSKLDFDGLFVGFGGQKPESRHVVPIGQLKGIPFMSIFRFKVWWTTHWTGLNGSDLEYETQILILDKSDEDLGRPYVVILPLIEGPFRASLQPGPIDDYVDMCVESGSTKVIGDSFQTILYIRSGPDPFKLVKDTMKEVQAHLGTFKLLEEKCPPKIVGKFGWCTWDAFYLKVEPQGVLEGVKGLVENGVPPGFVLIDDGWQSICHDVDPITDQEGMNRTSAGEQMPCRLIKYEENYKFREYKSPNRPNMGMKAFIRDLKEKFKTVEDVYVWHAFMGYWGGVRPNVPGLPEAEVVGPKLTPGLEMTMEDLAVDKIVNNGVGLVKPEKAHELYEGLHSHLEACGIDGVKIDVIHLLEMMAEDYGGRVELAKKYYKAITESIRTHFKGNGVIASMEQCNDFMLLGTETICLGRVGDDFWPTDPYGDINGTYWLQGCHMVHCAYNSLWMGNFIHPDWDMFQSTHPCAEFHAASRAISGGPIYVSDAVGKHNIPLLKRLVLPDGSILRCDYYALPTRDCLFVDPLHDGKTMLKIWNLNKFNGVLGVFNCQGGGWNREFRRNQCYLEYSKPISCKTSPKDIEWQTDHQSEYFAMYMSKQKKLILSQPCDAIEISLEPFNYELIVASPVTTLPWEYVKFAPIGLINMLNCGGAVRSYDIRDESEKRVCLGIKGAGEMRVFASGKPKACRVNGENVEFEYEDSMVLVQVPWNSDSTGFSTVEYLY